MSEDELGPDTPASPHPDAQKRHGDALLDGSGSRHGTPPEESQLPNEETPSDDDPEFAGP